VPGGSPTWLPDRLPFHAECIRHFSRHGFAYMGMKTIRYDVVAREQTRPNRLGWTEQCKDGSKMGVGMPEYLLIFRKPPTDSTNSYADEPIIKQKPQCFAQSNVYDVDAEGGVKFSACIRCGAPWEENPARYHSAEICRSSRQPGYSRSRWQVDAHGFTRSSGNRPLMPSDLEGVPHSTIFKLFRKYSLEQVYTTSRTTSASGKSWKPKHLARDLHAATAPELAPRRVDRRHPDAHLERGAISQG